MQKFRLPNGNVLIWLGTRSEAGVDHILILAGGDVLFLKTVKILPLDDQRKRIQSDLKQLDYSEFVTKYKIPVDSKDLWLELKRGVAKGHYPAYDKES